MNSKLTTDSIDVSYVAHLARLHLSREETAVFQEQLEHILEHVRMLQTVEVDGVEPTAHAVPVENVFREDEARPGLTRDEVLDNAPLARQGLFMVPRILE